MADDVEMEETEAVICGETRALLLCLSFFVLIVFVLRQSPNGTWSVLRSVEGINIDKAVGLIPIVNTGHSSQTVKNT